MDLSVRIAVGVIAETGRALARGGDPGDALATCLSTFLAHGGPVWH